MSGRASERTLLAPPAIRRVRRLKLLTAVLLMLAVAVVLMVFALVVAKADATYERDRVDLLLERQVAAGSGAVRVDREGELIVGLGDRAELAGGYPQLYVVAIDGGDRATRVVFSPAAPNWPEVDIVRVARDVVNADASVTRTMDADRTGPDEDETLRLYADPVRDPAGTPRAVVVGVANRATGEESHARLVTFMWWSGAVVLVFGIFVAVLLSRGRWWIADRVLVRHEQFLRDTAHELRAPVTALRALTEAGLAGDEPPERTLERVLMIARGTDEVIDDLLTLARMETGREPLRAEPVRLDLLVEALLRAREDQPVIGLDAGPESVTANPALVRRAIDNLLDNAVRHGRREDPTADISVTVRDGRVIVADRGPGMRPQLLTHLLERMGDGRHGSAGGLGLAIAGWVARVHGAELTATNRDGGGARFVIDLSRQADRDRHPRAEGSAHT